jgi:hypothetical protein
MDKAHHKKRVEIEKAQNFMRWVFDSLLSSILVDLFEAILDKNRDCWIIHFIGKTSIFTLVILAILKSKKIMQANLNFPPVNFEISRMTMKQNREFSIKVCYPTIAVFTQYCFIQQNYQKSNDNLKNNNKSHHQFPYWFNKVKPHKKFQ